MYKNILHINVLVTENYKKKLQGLINKQGQESS